MDREAPLEIAYRRPLRVARAVGCLHLASAAALLAAALPPAADCLGLLLLAWNHRRCQRALWGPPAERVTALLVRDAGDVRVRVGGGPAQPALLAPPSTVLASLVVLLLRTADGAHHTLVLTRDNVTADDFRRLRVRLRC